MRGDKRSCPDANALRRLDRLYVGSLMGLVQARITEAGHAAIDAACSASGE
ncbi:MULTISPECIES: hypothetical protein [Methylobacterium]|jgi:hypothetical protein|uniref:MarR family transcriptional regulator n=1 Tax=Methylobacterium longum TaxID=767694 RepID=A0ABT8AK72_9HYPH|nr:MULTISPECIES: hypothetical protein [Methylobacterium]MCJ2102839.1 hypothetical protein [Methylobacterium sp. E-046]MDN3570210.1 hypothetical protein [Methylobacterium longum]GJE13425.1 hypothetical protein FOHLNKBM_4488 [Methylobacterium longum]